MLVEFVVQQETQRIGARITIDNRAPALLPGPIIAAGAPVSPWVHFLIGFLIAQGLVTELERAKIVDDAKPYFIDAGFVWGDDGHDRKVPTLARERQSN